MGRKDLGIGVLNNRTNGGDGTFGSTWKLSAETREKMRKPKSEVTKEKMRKPKLVVTCPHCGLTGGKPTMYRFHFNNCKVIQIE